jgi:hypothetical protein
MPNLPISQLPTGSTLLGPELFAMVQDNITKQTSFSSILYAPTNNYGLFNQIGVSSSVTGSGTGVEASGSLLNGGIGTLSVPANGFAKGDAFKACMTGKLTATNNHTLEIKIISDGVDLADTGVITLSGTTNKNWRLDIDFSINEIGSAGTAVIATAGTFEYRQDAGGALIGEIFSFINSSSFDTTVDNTLQIEAIWGTTSGATDSIYSQLFMLNKVF